MQKNTRNIPDHLMSVFVEECCVGSRKRGLLKDFSQTEGPLNPGLGKSLAVKRQIPNAGGRTKGANEWYIVYVNQHGGDDVTSKLPVSGRLGFAARHQYTIIALDVDVSPPFVYVHACLPAVNMFPPFSFPRLCTRHFPFLAPGTQTAQGAYWIFPE